MVELALIKEADQRHRGSVRAGSSLDAETWEKQEALDAENLAKVTKILDERGYPGLSVVGPKLQSAAFLVIQHADLATQERYAPLLQAAADQGELPQSSMALLVDRLRIRKGQPQLYGTQVERGADGSWQPSHVEDPERLDERRRSVGLGPHAEYLAGFR